MLDGRADPVELVERIGLNAIVLAYSSGWILVPGALLGLALALGRPRSRLELAFGALFLTTTAAVLLESWPRRRVDQAQERYVFYVLPLAVLAFCAYAARGWPARTQLALIVSLLIAASAQVPLAGFTAAEGKSQSPFLIAAFRLEEAVGNPGSGSLLIAGAAAVFGVVLILLSAKVPRSGRRSPLRSRSSRRLRPRSAPSPSTAATQTACAPPTSRTSRRGSTGQA